MKKLIVIGRVVRETKGGQLSTVPDAGASLNTFCLTTDFGIAPAATDGDRSVAQSCL